ncbi:FadR/GntR family transcriptional regulator [Nitrospirillum iridis]|uniref:GntR family transcriptional repressor for pyruvate dehydrogenase complex n=1 Tax=Nitrospirillum iridis TaxID=765888 RepID=A0A7X0AVK5_9PROT|nr:FadR/GntR family transcriptional regulator [Nitrospirillum iridis]MBB6249474.1 GntR family transcriptional repressor for pyruvate dehydrogenase complex [Nitrospirillum iridis]
MLPIPASGQRLYRHVADAIAADIRRGTYAPGQRLPSERDLAEKFDVSRPTVREAMITLEILGLVEARHGSGIYVTDQLPAQESSAELDIGAFELTEARRLVEGEVAALAATTINDEELAELATLLHEIGEENARNAVGEKADRRFHLTIARATRNSALIGVVEQLWDMRYKSPLCMAMLERARTVGDHPRVEEHQRILHSLAARDSQGARAAMRDHLGRVIEGLLEATEMEAVQRARAEVAAKRNELRRRAGV